MLPENALAEEVIVVTGGGTGLGKSMAFRFSELKARVAILGRRREVLEETASWIEGKTGGEVLPLVCDVRNFSQVEERVEEIVSRWGKITGLVNNAAGNFLARSEKLTPNGFRSVVEIVLFGTFHCTLACGRRMIAQGEGGRILNIATTYAFTGSAFVLPSACAKAGVVALTRSLAVEWGRYRIRVNAIAPGPFPTEGAFSRLMLPGMEESALARIPLGRFGEHEELTHLAAYMMSPYSAYMTGEVVVLDGGEWLMSGGGFNALTLLDPDQLDSIFQFLRGKTQKGA
jgi:NAD(P)-dependent dehydrogenase (short-subunit alcohol dehydrogenase family)